MFFEFIGWWYGQGYKEILRTPFKWANMISRNFSMIILVRTLFSPWHRIITPPGHSLDEKLRAAVDNLTSRAVGFFVRSGVLAASTVLLVVSTAAGLLLAFVWPLLPPAVVYLLMRSLTG